MRIIPTLSQQRNVYFIGMVTLDIRVCIEFSHSLDHFIFFQSHLKLLVVVTSFFAKHVSMIRHTDFPPIPQLNL